MKREILEQALNEISDRHIAEAAGKKRQLPIGWIASVAAALAVVILCVSVLQPFSVAKAESTVCSIYLLIFSIIYVTSLKLFTLK